MNLFCYYFLLFFVYSFFGWIIESITCSILAHQKVLNRGFLIGPYIPIYGTAAIMMILFLEEYKKDPFVLFSMAVVYASILEYFTSFWMEKLFSARWWDYTHEKWNLNGRICLKNSVLFGMLGLILLYGIQPMIHLLISMIPNQILVICVSCILLVFLIDVFISFWIVSRLSIRVKNVRGDATQQIDKEVKKVLKHDRILYKRLFHAFPKVRFTTKNGNILINRIRKVLDDADVFLLEKKKEMVEMKNKIRNLKKK